MHLPPCDDASADPERWREFVIRTGFGHLVAAGAGRDLPVVVPTQFHLDGDTCSLHLARANPALGALAENPRCVISVAGDWAYIPGPWKAIGDEDPRRGIPTTYYAAVQMECTARVVDTPAEVAAVLREQRARLEPEGDHLDPREHGPRLGSIRGIICRIDRVRAKFKFGGNLDDAHRAAVAQRLEDRAGPGDAAALAHVRRGRTRLHPPR